MYNITKKALGLMMCLFLFGISSHLLGQQSLQIVSNPVAGPYCVDQIVKFGSSLPTNGASYIWAVDGGEIVQDVGETIIVTWDEPGTYTVTLIQVEGTNRQVASITVNISAGLGELAVESDPAILCMKEVFVDDVINVGGSGTGLNLVGANNEVCVGNTFQFSAIPAGLSPGSYQWSGTGPIVISGSGETVSVSFPGAGIASLTLTVTEGTCSESVTFNFGVFPHPTTQIVANGMANAASIDICKGATVFFSQNTVNNGTDECELESVWNFPGGVSTNVESPEFTFETPGTYTVNLSVSCCGMCEGQASITVNVSQDPAPELSCVSFICEENKGTYESPDACEDAIWYAIGGTIVDCNNPTADGGCEGESVTVRWGDTGPFALQLDNSLCGNGGGGTCSNLSYIEVPVIEDLEITGPAVLDQSVFSSAFYELESSLSGLSYTISGSYIGASGTVGPAVDQRLSIRPWFSANQIPVGATQLYLTANYTIPETGCQGQAFKLVDICASTRIIDDNCNPYVGRSQRFSLQTINGQSVAGNVSWDIARDGVPVHTASGLLIDYTFPSAGSYTLTAELSDLEGICGQPAPLTVEVSDPESEGGITGPTVIPCTAGTEYRYEIEEIEGFTYTIDVDGGSLETENDQSPADILWTNLPGKITVKYKANESNSCLNDFLFDIELNVDLESTPNPAISGPANACLDSREDYTFNILNGESYEWEIIPSTAGSIVAGQGSPSVTVAWHTIDPNTPSPTFPIQATLRLNSLTCGATSTVDYPVSLFPPEKVDIAIYELNMSGPNDPQKTGSCPVVSFTAVAEENTDWQNPTYQWTVGGVVQTETSNTLDYSNVFPDDSDFDLIINVTVTHDGGICGNTATGQSILKVYPEPLAFLTHTENLFCSGDPVSTTLFATVQNYPGATQEYVYYRNGVIIATTTSPSYTVTSTGSYYFEVVRTYPGNVECRSTSNTVQVRRQNCNGGGCAPCAANITWTQDCNTFNFTATACPGATVQKVYTSTFVNAWGNTLTADFSLPGMYFVFARIRDANGCVYKIKRRVPVTLLGDFDSEIVCQPLGRGISISDRSLYFVPQTPASDYEPSSWVWTLLDANGNTVQSSTTQQGNHLFSGVLGGTYTIRMEVSNLDGVSCTEEKSIVVDPVPTADFTFPDLLCAGTPVAFEATSSGAQFWDFGDMAFSGQSDPERAYAQGGQYNVTLRQIDDYGCPVSRTKTITIANRLPGPFKILDNGVTPTCANTPITLSTDFPNNVPNSHIWNTGETTPTIMITDPGRYDVDIIDANGCIYELPSRSFLDFPRTMPPVIEPFNGTSACEGSLLIFLYEGSYRSSDVLTWTVTNVATGTPAPFTVIRNGRNMRLNPNSAPLPAGTYEIVLSWTRANCTLVSEPLEIVIAPTINVSIDAAGSPCSGGMDLTANATGGTGFQYTWDSGGETGASLIGASAGEYTVTVSNSEGCAGQASYRVAQLPDLSGLPTGCYEYCKKELANGITFSLPNPPLSSGSGTGCTYSYSYQWYKDNTLITGETSPSITLGVGDEGDYYLEMTLNASAGCTGGSCTFESDVISISLKEECDPCGFVWADFPEVNCVGELPDGSNVYEVKVKVENEGENMIDVMIRGRSGDEDIFSGVAPLNVASGDTEELTFQFTDNVPLSSGLYCVYIFGVSEDKEDTCGLDLCFPLPTDCDTVREDCGLGINNIPPIPGTVTAQLDLDSTLKYGIPIFRTTIQITTPSFGGNPTYVFGPDIQTLHNPLPRIGTGVGGANFYFSYFGPLNVSLPITIIAQHKDGYFCQTDRFVIPVINQRPPGQCDISLMVKNPNNVICLNHAASQGTGSDLFELYFDLLDNLPHLAQDYIGNPYYIFTSEGELVSAGAAQASNTVNVPYGGALGQPLGLILFFTNHKGKPCSVRRFVIPADCKAPRMGVSMKHDIRIFPNPTKGYITVSLQRAAETHTEIVISDLQGKQLLSHVIPVGKASKSLLLSPLSPGMYLVTIRQDGKTITTRKVIRE